MLSLCSEVVLWITCFTIETLMDNSELYRNANNPILILNWLCSLYIYVSNSQNKGIKLPMHDIYKNTTIYV